MSESTTFTKRFNDGRIITVRYEDRSEIKDKILSEKKHQDEKYERTFSKDTQAVAEAFADLCTTLEWD